MSGMLQGRITLTSGQTFRLNENGAFVAPVQVNSGVYYLSTQAPGGVQPLLTAFENELNAAGNGTYSVTLNTATGQIEVIAIGVANFGIDWIGADLPNLLGFTQGNLAGNNNHTSQSVPQSLWFPGACPVTLAHSEDWRGIPEVDMHQNESPRGDVFSLVGERKMTMELQFDAVRGCRTWIAHENVPGESFERFFLHAIAGDGVGSSPGGPVRWHQDANTLNKFGSYYVVGLRTFRPEQVTRGWAGLYRFRVPRLVLLPEELRSGVYA